MQDIRHNHERRKGLQLAGGSRTLDFQTFIKKWLFPEFRAGKNIFHHFCPSTLETFWKNALVAHGKSPSYAHGQNSQLPQEKQPHHNSLCSFVRRVYLYGITIVV